MNKLYDLIVWHNNTTPALNEDNLNAMSEAINDIDDRVLDIGGAVLEVIPELDELIEDAEAVIDGAREYAESAEQSAQDASDSASAASDDELDAEAWAVGQRNGQDVPPDDPTYHNNAKYWAGQSGTSTFSSMADVDIVNPVTGQVPVYNANTQKWENETLNAGNIPYDNTTSGLTATDAQAAIDEVEGNVDSVETDIANIHKVSTLAVSTSGWASDTTSQSGTTLYKKSLSLSHVYATSPSVDIGAGTGYTLPTATEQEAYDLLLYVTVDGTTLYLYASDIPTTAFYINVEGVD